MVPVKYSSTSPMTQIFLEMIFPCPSSISQTASLGHMRLNLNSTFDFSLRDLVGKHFLPSARTQGCTSLRLRGTDLCSSEARVVLPDRLPERPVFYYTKGGMMVDRTFQVGECVSLSVNKSNQG